MRKNSWSISFCGEPCMSTFGTMYSLSDWRIVILAFSFYSLVKTSSRSIAVPRSDIMKTSGRISVGFSFFAGVTGRYA